MQEKFERKFRSTADGFAAKNGGYPIYSVEWTDGMIDGVNAALLSIVKTDFFGHDEKDKANDSFYKTTQVTRAILLLIEEEMKRQGVGRIEDLKCPDRSTEESLQLEQRLKQAIEKEPVKMVVPYSICAPGYESGLASRLKEEQKNCPYCHGKLGLEAGFHAEASIGKDESGNSAICVETLEQTFYIPIKRCPMCGRKLEAK